MLLNEDLFSPELIPAHVQALYRDHPEKAVPHLADLLGKRSPEVRLAAVGALGRIPSGLPALRKASLEDRNEIVLAEICEILGYAQDRPSLKRMRELATNHKSSLVRSYAAVAVSDIEGSEAISFLRSLLPGCRSRRLRVSLDFSLLQAGDWSRLRSLLSGLKSRNEIVRCRTAFYLEEDIFRAQSEQILPALREALKNENDLGPKKAISGAIEALSVSDSATLRALPEETPLCG